MAKSKKTATYNLNLDQIQAIKRTAAQEAIGTVIELTLGIPTIVLNDKFGFTGEQLDRFVDYAVDLYNEYEEGRLSLEDIREALKAETGVEIQKTRKVKKGKVIR